MKDKIKIIYSPLADFSTAPWGVLRVVDGKVVLDKIKAFNRARRMLNEGANAFRVLRRGVWETEKPFDWEDDGYWPLFNEYLLILNDPWQYRAPRVTNVPGAEVWVDIFDGCSEQWMYNDYKKARKLIQAMFSNLGDLDFVKFRAGNEMNKPQSTAFIKDVVYPEFKAAHRYPWNYGASYSDDQDYLEDQKGFADRLWKQETTKIIWRDVHKVKDSKSTNLLHAFEYWAAKGHPIRVIWSCDGVFDGQSPCDWIVAKGKIQRRPSVEEWKSAVKYVLDNAKLLEIPVPLDTKVKYGFEYLPKAANQDECSAQGIRVIRNCYLEKFGALPENCGEYPYDWIEPVAPPAPPIPPEPPPPPEEKPWWYWWFGPNSLWGKFIKWLKDRT